jgi:hypothetical protein
MLIGLNSQKTTHKELMTVVRGNMKWHAPSSVTRVDLGHIFK